MLSYLLTYLRTMRDEELGGIFGEYGFIFLLVVLAAIGGLGLLGTNLNNFFNSIAGNF